MSEKRCVRCNQTLPSTSFYKNPNTKDKLTSWCKNCTKYGKNIEDTKVVVHIDSFAIDYSKHVNLQLLDVYFLDWWCPKCKSKHNLCLVNKQGKPYSDEDLVKLPMKDFEDTVLESEVWCERCVRDGFKTIGKIKRQNRHDIAPDIWNLAKLRYAARKQTGPILETIHSNSSTAKNVVVTSKLALYNLLLSKSECAICHEKRPALNIFYYLVPQPKRADLGSLIQQGVTIDEFISEVEKCTFLCQRCALAADLELESTANLLPLRVSVE
jgi:hypothetical protein